jgi:hypothetical protein
MKTKEQIAVEIVERLIEDKVAIGTQSHKVSGSYAAALHDFERAKVREADAKFAETEKLREEIADCRRLVDEAYARNPARAALWHDLLGRVARLTEELRART